MDALKIIDAGGNLEQVLFKLHMAAHGDKHLDCNKEFACVKQLAAVPIESLQALMDMERAF